MPAYDLTIRLRLELADDAEARTACPAALVKEVAEEAVAAFHGKCPTWAPPPKPTVKLQRLYKDRPPRLLAKWPPE